MILVGLAVIALLAVVRMFIPWRPQPIAPILGVTAQTPPPKPKPTPRRLSLRARPSSTQAPSP